MQDLQEVTHDLHYENYRATRLADGSDGESAGLNQSMYTKTFAATQGTNNLHYYVNFKTLTLTAFCTKCSPQRFFNAEHNII